MGRKFMTRDVTKTTVKIAKIEMIDGLPQAVELPDEVLIGNVNEERAAGTLKTKFDHPITVLGVEPNTEKYRMSVEDFLKHAEVVTEDEQ